MPDNLKRYAPDIKALGSGKALAVMNESSTGVWCHIQEVRGAKVISKSQALSLLYNRRPSEVLK